MISRLVGDLPKRQVILFFYSQNSVGAEDEEDEEDYEGDGVFVAGGEEPDAEVFSKTKEKGA